MRQVFSSCTHQQYPKIAERIALLSSNRIAPLCLGQRMWVLGDHDRFEKSLAPRVDVVQREAEIG